MGRHQIEAPWTFHMSFAYFCDISRLLCNKLCVQVNLLCATYCILTSMVFHLTKKLSKINMFLHDYFLSHLEKYNYNRHMTKLLIIVVVICLQMRITVKLSFIITFKDIH